MQEQAALAVKNQNAQTNFQSGEIDVFRIGEVFAKSGYFTDAKDSSQAIVKILAGREIGIGAMASMTGFHIVQGKPTLSANLIASIIKNKNSGYNYRVLELSEVACEIEFFEHGESIGKSRFTIEEAKNAGLVSKDVWKKHPKNMLFARAISNGAKWFCPDVFNGATVYTPEELGANVNADGEVISEPASVHALPAKSKLIEAAKEKSSALSSSPLDWRDEVTTLLENLGTNAEAALKRFDGFGSQEERANALCETRKHFIKTTFYNRELHADEIVVYLEGFDVDALEEASDEQLAAICADLLSKEPNQTGA